MDFHLLIWREALPETKAFKYVKVLFAVFISERKRSVKLTG